MSTLTTSEDDADPPVPDLRSEHDGTPIALSRRRDIRPAAGRPSCPDRGWARLRRIRSSRLRRAGLVAAALAGDDLLELGLEVERLEAVHAPVEVAEDLPVLLGRQLAVEERLDVAQRLPAVGVDRRSEQSVWRS